MSLPAGSTIGIIGGGQLGRMLAMAAARLGYRTVVLEPQPDCPAAQVANRQITAAYDDPAALAELAAASSVVTYEFENVPVAAASALAAKVPVYPPARALDVAQDRVSEKTFLNGIGIATADFRPVDNDDELTAALKAFGGSGILKTRRMGYDGKGQRVFRNMEAGGFAGTCEAMGNVPLILESFVPFEREISVIAARGLDGAVAAYDPAENVHRNGILHTSTLPAAIMPETAEAARAAASKILVGARLCRRHRRRVLRAGRWLAAGQRDRATRAQFRPLDGSRLHRFAVRAAHPRRCRLAARKPGPPF